MRKIRQLLLVSLVVTGALFTSCIKDEALNVEADIISATFEGANTMLITEPNIKNDAVEFRLIDEPESNLLAPTFVLSKGATIQPESGTERDFTTPQTYVVTSENGEYQKTYTINFFIDNGVLNSYSFENVEVIETEGYPGQYHQFYTLLANQSKKRDWASGNEGYSFLLGVAESSEFPMYDEITPEVYPTRQMDGYKGKGVKMETKSTGEIGTSFGSPLAAGNLFLGDFDISTVTTPMKTTRFGQPYRYSTAPIAVKGYFKYKAGEDFKVNNKDGSDLTKDIWDAYAILFEKQEKDNYLSGDHNFEDERERIVSIAKLDEAQRIETNEWTEFKIKFEDVANRKFDAAKEYMFTIVFSSSKEGALFNGAVGSQLYIDEVEIVFAE